MSKSPRVQPIDLASKRFISEPKFPQLDAVFERLQRDLRLKLSQKVGQHIYLENPSRSFITYENLINTLPAQTYSEVWKCGGLKGRPFLVIVNPKLLSLFGEYLLGGQSLKQRLFIQDKEISPIDKATLRWVFKDFGGYLQEAFSPITSLDPSFVRSETKTQFLTILPPTDPVFVFSFIVEIGGISGELSVVFPLSTLEPLKDKLKEPFLVEESASRLGDVNPDFHRDISVVLQAELPTFYIPIQKIQDLKAGECLITPIRLNQALWATVDGRPVKRLYITNQSLSKGLFRVEDK